MASGDDLVERMRRLGFRASHDALSAFLTHAHKSRLGPTETIEQLVELEERSRAAINLARRPRAACLGTFKPLDRFDWSHPKGRSFATSSSVYSSSTSSSAARMSWSKARLVSA